MERKMILAIVAAGIFIVIILSHYNKRIVWQHVKSLSQTLTGADMKNLSFEEKVRRFKLSMDDEEVLERIRKTIKPPEDPINRRFSLPPGRDTSQHGQPIFVDKLLKQRTNGYFIECGAFDGVTYSNSAFLEVTRNWTGLLIEPGPSNYKNMLGLKRNASSINACLSPTRSPQILDFLEVGAVGGLTNFFAQTHVDVLKQRNPGKMAANSSTPIICYPLYSILLAMGHFRIDYFSLDVEGPELPILSTIPFDKVYIDVITIEFGIWGGNKTAIDQKLEDVRRFMASTKLYKEAGVLLDWDVAFKRID